MSWVGRLGTGGLYTKGYAAPSLSSWAVTNLHGDTIATITGTTVTAGYVYDPFGQPLNTGSGVVDLAATPSTRTGTTTDAWHGGAQRGYEHAGGLNQILMGARTYLPELGIFTATDPIEGGNTTTYTYPQHPTNHSDLTGTNTTPEGGGPVSLRYSVVEGPGMGGSTLALPGPRVGRPTPPSALCGCFGTRLPGSTRAEASRIGAGGPRIGQLRKMGVSQIKKWLKNEFGHTNVERFKKDVLGSDRVAPWDVYKDSSGQIILQTKRWTISNSDRRIH